ncbi:hypothetical protein Tco_1406229 [Tanacetum coccineum]
MSSKRNNIRLAIRNAKSEVVCAMCKQCLIIVNHDVCVLNYVNDMNSRALNKNANVSNVENQKKHKPKVWKPKKVGSKERLASPKPSTPRSCLRWLPTGRIFNLKGKIIATSESECQSDCFKGDNACTSNPLEPTSKWFPNSTFSMIGFLTVAASSLDESIFKTSCSIDNDKFMMKAQVHVSNSSAISDVQALPQKNIIDKITYEVLGQSSWRTFNIMENSIIMGKQLNIIIWLNASHYNGKSP